MDELQNYIFIEITQPFLYLEGAPKYILSAPLKKEHKNKNVLIFDNNFKSHDPCVKQDGKALQCTVYKETKPQGNGQLKFWQEYLKPTLSPSKCYFLTQYFQIFLEP